MKDTISIKELIQGSSVYDDTENIKFLRVAIKEKVTFVHYEYDGNKWLHIWDCKNGEIEIDKVSEPTYEFNENEEEYKRIVESLS